MGLAAGRGELALVMELMELGSLGDLLQNSMFELDADFVGQARKLNHSIHDPLTDRIAHLLIHPSLCPSVCPSVPAPAYLFELCLFSPERIGD
jgi:hypothetical protein